LRKKMGPYVLLHPRSLYNQDFQALLIFYARDFLDHDL
jgi:hypothetical protein